MPIRNFQIGFAAETTYGTRAVPTRFLEANSYGIVPEIDRIEARGLRAGVQVTSSTRWSSGKKAVEGETEFYVPRKGFGLLFKAALGTATITTPTGATTTRRHAHTIGTTLPFLTIQEGIPDSANVSRPWDFYGSMVQSMTLSNSVDELLMASFNWLSRDADNTQSLATASYATGDGLFSFTGAVITIGGSSYDASEFSMELNNNLTPRFYLGSALTKQPVAQGLTEVTGSFQSDYLDNVAVNRFLDGTTAAILARWDGDTIEGAFKYYVEVSIPVARFDGEAPTADGPEMIGQPLNFKALDDDTLEPLTITMQSTDTAS